MNRKNTFKIVIAFAVVLALVLPSSAMFANIEENKNVSSSKEDNNIDLQALDDSIIVTETVDWWPMARHDLANTGYSSGTAPNTNNVLWSYTIDGDVSSPVVADGKVYVGSWDQGHTIYCLNESDGSLIWSYTVGDWIRTCPAIADGKVFFGSDDSNVYCLDSTDGSLIWNYNTGDRVLSSPAVTDGKVFIGSNDYKIYCLDALNGSLIWSYATGNSVSSSPAVADGKVFFGSYDRSFYCLDATDGSLIWSCSTDFPGRDAPIGGSPIVVEGKVFFCRNGRDPVLYCRNATDGSLIWWYDAGHGTQSPAVAYGKIYFGCSNDHKVYCLNVMDGSLIWTYTTGDIALSPAVADGKVYIGSYDANLYCLDALDGSLIWSYTTDGTRAGSSPAIANGKVFIGSQDVIGSSGGKLYCFGMFPGHDVGIVSIDSPATSSFDVITPEFTVINHGIFNEINVPVNLQITKIGTGNVEYDETITITIDSEKNLVVTFPDWTPDDIGASISVQYRVTACTQLATDENPANNYKSKMIALYPDDIDWWPMNRHDLNNTGYSTSTAPNTNNVLWKYRDTSSVVYTWSSPVVADGKIYVGVGSGFYACNLYCLDAYDGSLVWKYAAFDEIKTAPAVADGRVYFTSEDRNLYCLNGTDGSLIWKYNHGAALNTATPTIVDGKIYIGAQCIDATDGSLIWRYDVINCWASYSSPAVADGKVYTGVCIPGDMGSVYCLNATDGSLIWNYTTMDQIYFSSPAVADGMVYIGSVDDYLYCLNSTDGSLIWKYRTGADIRSSPAVVDGKVFFGSGDGNVSCLNASDGSFIWSYATDRVVFSFVSPVVADGKVYIGSQDYYLFCLDASDGSLIWKYYLGYARIILSSPAIADGRLYVGTSSGCPWFYCFGPQSPNQPPYRPSNPDPPNHATNVDINADLSWTGGDPDGDPVTYDVYFGTTSPPPKVVSNQSSTTYDPDLDYETQYYWQIVAWDNHSASAEGSIWDFTTEEEDTTSPVTTCDLDGTMEGGVYITDVTVTLIATDDISGVAGTMYKLNDGEWEEYLGTPFVVSDDGEHTISFYSIDNAGNTEEPKTESFTIQHPCPIDIEISGGLGVNAVIANTGEDDITDLEWSINITGGILGLIDKQVSGTIPTLAAGDSETIKSGIFFGLGQIRITVTAGCAEETTDGKQLIIFTKVE